MSVKTRRNGGNGQLPSLSRYDFLLLVLPLPVLVGTVASLLGYATSSGLVGLSSLPSVFLLGYALFVAAPTENRQRSR